MHGIIGRWHAIVDNGVDDGVIVSQDARNTTGIIIDAIVSMYAIGATGNGDGGNKKASIWHAQGRQKQVSSEEQRSALNPPSASDTATKTSLVPCSLTSFWANMGLVKIIGWGRVVDTFMVHISTVVFLGWTMQCRIAL